MPISTVEFRHFNTPPGMAHAVRAAGTGSAQPVTLSTGPPLITSLVTTGDATAGYFTDQGGSPRLWAATETWGLPVNAGQWNSGNWQADYDNFFASRAAQGFTVVMTDPVWSPTGNGAHSGNTWDGLTPLTGGTANPSGATLNSTFWARIDYMLTSAAAQGITIALAIYNGDNQSSGFFTNGWTATQWTAYATLVGTRYKTAANLIWLVGNDAFSPFTDTQFDAILSGLSAAGDTHLITPWYNAECTGRYDTSAGTVEPWGRDHGTFNFTYSYNQEYWIIEYAYGEVANQGAASLQPVIHGDGYFFQGTSGASYDSTYDRALRQMWWWVLASGGRGVIAEAENVYPWSSSGAPAAVTGDWFFANNAAHIVSAFTGLTGWHQLVPDTANALVTAGRGTRAAGFTSGGGGGQYEPAFTSAYVAASRTPDTGSGSSLAVLYLPNHTTITIDQAKMTAGYTATWIDPVTGATSSATPGSTYNSTAKGNNSQGDPDWALALHS